jgi:hypothetical protein
LLFQKRLLLFDIRQALYEHFQDYLMNLSDWDLFLKSDCKNLEQFENYFFG